MAHFTVPASSAEGPLFHSAAVPWPVAAWFIALVELLAIAALAWAMGENQFAFVTQEGDAPQALYGTFVAATFVIVSLARRHYTLEGLLSGSQANSTLIAWTSACLLGIVALYLLDDDPVILPGAISFFLLGLVPAIIGRLALRRVVRAAIDKAWLGGRRVLLIGPKTEIDVFMRQLRDSRHELEVVGAIATRSDDLALSGAVEQARALRPERIILVSRWADARRIERWLEILMAIPAAIHLSTPLRLERYRRQLPAQRAPLSDLVLIRAPLQPAERFVKRIFDLLAASAGLLLLSPLLVLVGLLIRLDSAGPALFKQARRGFNNEVFFIYKFRTMAIDAEAKGFSQAAPGDPRITRIGRFLRRWNIDELPQLLNVLEGEMSIVGPRPHALSHEVEFSGDIDQYARRHNVKPGITGWAQVNGYRGPTDTPEKMRARIAHDFYYIDNWSMWFDAKIMLLTLFSPKAFRNAF